MYAQAQHAIIEPSLMAGLVLLDLFRALARICEIDLTHKKAGVQTGTADAIECPKSCEVRARQR